MPQVHYTYKIGDVSDDGVVNLKDASLIQKALLGDVTLTEKQQKAADVVNDGKISIADVVAVLRYLVGYDNTYKVGEVVAVGSTDPTTPTTPTQRPTSTPTTPTERPTEAPTSVSDNVVYLDFSALETGDERFAIWTWGPSNSGQWVDMTKNSSGIYQAELPSDCTNVVFVRMNGATSENSWDNKWNQTEDLTFSSSTPLYKASGWNNEYFRGSWSSN